MTVKGFADAGDLTDHADLHHLRFDLPEASDKRDPPRFGGNEDAGGPQHRVDDVARPQRELLDGACDAGTHEGLVQLDLRLFERGFGACLLCRQKRGNFRLQGLLVRKCGVNRTLPAVNGNLQTLDLAQRDDIRVALPKLGLGLQFVHSLQICALRLLDLAIRRRQFGLRHRCLGVDLRYLPARRLPRCLLFGTVEPKQRLRRPRPCR